MLCASYREAYYAVSNETFFSALAGGDEPHGAIWGGDAFEVATAHAAVLEVRSVEKTTTRGIRSRVRNARVGGASPTTHDVTVTGAVPHARGAHATTHESV